MFDTGKLTLITMNVRGMGDYNKRKFLFSYFREHKAQIALVQESHNSSKINENWQVQWGGPIYNSYGTTNARGVAILLNRSFAKKISDIEQKSDSEGSFTLDKQRYAIANIYGPNRDCPDFYENVDKVLSEITAEHVIMGGDFNLVLDNKLDCKNRAESHHVSRAKLKEIINKNDLFDIWRVRNPEKSSFTWH